MELCTKSQHFRDAWFYPQWGISIALRLLQRFTLKGNSSMGKRIKSPFPDFWKNILVRYHSNLNFLVLWRVFKPYKVIFTLCLPWQQSHCASVGCWNGLFAAHERNESELFFAAVYSPWHCFRKSRRETDFFVVGSL